MSSTSSSSSFLPPPPLPSRAVSAVRSAARRAALGLLPLPRRTAREVERSLGHSSPSSPPSSAAAFSTTFPLAAVRRFPPPPPRPRGGGDGGGADARRTPPPSPSPTSSSQRRRPLLRLPHWSLVVPSGWALPVWRALVASKSGGVGRGGSGGKNGGGRGRGGKKAKKTGGKKGGRAAGPPLLRGKGVAVAGQREWRWASSICANNPCLSPFYPHDWAEAEVAKGVRREEEASAEREDARRPPGKKKNNTKKTAKAGGEARALFPPSFAVARTWQQVREALRAPEGQGDGEPREQFVPAALWPERRGTLAADSRVFLRRSSSPCLSSSSASSPSPSPLSLGEFLGAVTTAPPRGCPPGVAPAAGLLRARALWGARFAAGTKEEEKEDERGEEGQGGKEEEEKKRRAKSKRPSESSVRVVVVLPDGREVVARAAPSGVAASLW